MILAAVLLAFSMQIAKAEQTTLYASAVRAATITSSDIVKTSNYRGIHLIVSVTAVPGGDTITPKIQGKSASGVYYDILVGAAIAATGTTVLKINPSAAVLLNAVASDTIPDVWRVIVTHSAGSNFTYVVDYNTLQ